jgi:uncharacterized PurR-regulated membrane protein YhhQ (DUF165 family)
MMTRRIATSAVLVGAYLAAIVAANLITTHYAKQGHPEVSVYTAFALVAFDFVARDVLHDWYRGRTRVAVLAALILAGSLVSWLANPDSAEVAKWSALAFGAAMLVDGAVYAAYNHLPWLERSNLSNVAGAITDSAVFCAGLGFPFIVAFGQVTAKVAGGLLFALAVDRLLPENVRPGRARRAGA